MTCKEYIENDRFYKNFMKDFNAAYEYCTGIRASAKSNARSAQRFHDSYENDKAYREAADLFAEKAGITFDEVKKCAAFNRVYICD